MTSFRFKIWRLLVKLMFLNKDKDAALDSRKERRFDMPIPPRALRKRLNIEKETFREREVFYINSKKAKRDKVLLYFHGGAFVAGIARLHWDFMERLAACNYPIVLPDYPLAPENDHRETCSFVLALYKQLLQEYKPEHIYVLGDSAGGNLCLSLSLLLNKEGIPQPKKLILLSPWLDLTMSNPELHKLAKHDVMISINKLKQAGKLYANNSSPSKAEISPLFGDLSCLPETHYFIGSHDVLYADAEKMKEVMDEQGANITFYEYDKMMHVWMLFSMPEAKKVILEIKKIIGAQ